MSPLEPESGIWYAVCWLVFLTRLLSRRIHAGSWAGLKTDDYLICVAMGTLTAVMVVMHIVVHTSSNLIAPGEVISSFSPEEIQTRIYGSKLVLVVEQMQCCTIWLVKACLLLMYMRLTTMLPQHRLVIIVAVYTLVGFIVMEILYLGVWCRPFNSYWAIPTTKQCSAATNHLITNAVFNISSDIMIISLPMPLLFQVKLPLKNKLILVGVFMIGAFNIVAAVLNKYYSFMHPFGTEWPQWYLRESYTAILCANLPLIYPLIQRVFKLKNWSHDSYPSRYRSGSHPLTTPSALRSQRKSTITSRPINEGISKTVSVDVRNSSCGRELGRSESEERINVPALPRQYQEGDFGQSAWVSGGLELDPMSGTSSKSQKGSSMTSRSSTSMEHRR